MSISSVPHNHVAVIGTGAAVDVQSHLYSFSSPSNPSCTPSSSASPTFPGVGHTPPWEAADWVAELIVTALNGHGRDAIEHEAGTQAPDTWVAASQPGERCR